eukprot:10317428-Lingulodinium_polyedra.AAC.1
MSIYDCIRQCTYDMRHAIPLDRGTGFRGKSREYHSMTGLGLPIQHRRRNIIAPIVVRPWVPPPR